MVFANTVSFQIMGRKHFWGLFVSNLSIFACIDAFLEAWIFLLRTHQTHQNEYFHFRRCLEFWFETPLALFVVENNCIGMSLNAAVSLFIDAAQVKKMCKLCIKHP